MEGKTRNPTYKAFMKEMRRTGAIPKKVSDYMGYGIYIGRK